MNSFKNLALFFSVFFGLAISSLAQSRTAVKSRFEIDDSTPIFHKVTGDRITREEFRAIIQKSPRVHLEKEIDEKGEIASLTYDPNGSGMITRDTNSRTKPNQSFPNFIFASTTNENINLKELKGKIVVLYFNMGFREPFASQQQFSDFENILKVSSDRTNIIPLIVTHSTTEEVEDFIEKVKVPYPIVANGTNFFDKYIIMKIPSFIVIKKDGTLGAYADDLDELKQVLSRLK